MHTNGSVVGIEIYGIHRTGSAHLPQRMQRFFLTMTPRPFAGSKHPWDRPGTGGGVAGQARSRLKTCRQSSRRGYPYPCGIPGEIFVHKPGAGKRAGMAADAALHPRCCQDLHSDTSFTAPRPFPAGEASQVSMLIAPDRSLCICHQSSAVNCAFLVRSGRSF